MAGVLGDFVPETWEHADDYTVLRFDALEGRAERLFHGLIRAGANNNPVRFNAKILVRADQFIRAEFFGARRAISSGTSST